MKKFSIFLFITSFNLNLASAAKTHLDLADTRMHNVYGMLSRADLIKLGHVSHELGTLIAGKLHDKILRDIQDSKDLRERFHQLALQNRSIERSMGLSVSNRDVLLSLSLLLEKAAVDIRRSILIFAHKYWDLLNVNLNIQPLTLTESEGCNDLWTCELSGVKHILNEDQTEFIGFIEPAAGIVRLYLDEGGTPKDNLHLSILYFLPYQLRQSDAELQGLCMKDIWRSFQIEADYHERLRARLQNRLSTTENPAIEDTELPNVADMSQDSHELESQSFFSSFWSWVTNLAHQIYDWVIWW